MASNGIPSWSTTAASNVLANTGVNWDEGQAPSTVNDSARQILADIALWFANSPGSLVENLSFTCSVSSNALTIALKRRDGSDPTSVNPVRVAFRNATAATGDYSIISVTAATSLVISSGSTLGTSNSTAFRFWIVGFNDDGTFRLGAVNCLSGTSIYPLRDDVLASSTAEGGAGAADSAHVIYTGSAVSAKAMRVLGYIEYSSGLAAAGTYASAPTKVQLFGPGVSLPGQVVQTQRNDSSAVATGTTTLPLDNTTPQNTEGDQYMSQAITPSSPANVLEVVAQGHFASSVGAGATLIAAIFQDSTASALKTAMARLISAGTIAEISVKARLLAATTSETTMKLRAGSSSAGTTTFNGEGGAGYFNGTFSSFMECHEVMA